MSRKTGRCQCGAIKISANGDPMMALHCHCLDCQKAAGAGHTTFAAFPADAVSVDGQTTSYDSPTDSGGISTRHFCPTCGSRLFATTTSVPGMVAIALAALDEPGAITPTSAVYTKRRHDWDRIAGEMPEFEAMPPMPGSQAAE